MAVFVVMQGLVFAVWAFWAFRCLFRMRAWAVAETGRSLPGTRAALRAFRFFATQPQFRRDKGIFLLLTGLLLSLTAMFGILHQVWGW
jgi:hypothetical protein